MGWQSIPASGKEYASVIYQAYIQGNMDTWRQVLDEIECSSPEDTDSMLELIHFYYGYTGYLIGSGQTTEAANSIKKSEEWIK